MELCVLVVPDDHSLSLESLLHSNVLDPFVSHLREENSSSPSHPLSLPSIIPSLSSEKREREEIQNEEERRNVCIASFNEPSQFLHCIGSLFRSGEYRSLPSSSFCFFPSSVLSHLKSSLSEPLSQHSPSIPPQTRSPSKFYGTRNPFPFFRNEEEREKKRRRIQTTSFSAPYLFLLPPLTTSSSFPSTLSQKPKEEEKKRVRGYNLLILEITQEGVLPKLPPDPYWAACLSRIDYKEWLYRKEVVVSATLGGAYWAIKDIQKARQFALRTLSAARLSGNRRQMIISYIYIGYHHFISSDFEEAKKYFYKCFLVSETVLDAHVKSMARAAVYHIRQKLNSFKGENKDKQSLVKFESEEIKQWKELMENTPEEERDFQHLSKEEEKQIEDLLKDKDEFKWATAHRPHVPVLF